MRDVVPMVSTPAEKLEQMGKEFKTIQKAIFSVVALVGILVVSRKLYRS